MTPAAIEKAILRVWGEAFRFKYGLVAEYHELLNSEKPEFADVSQAEHHISWISSRVKKGEHYFIRLANSSDPSSFLMHSDKPSLIAHVSEITSIVTGVLVKSFGILDNLVGE
ncbi:uncharacterized protein F4812DRAFT_431608 [Daldinia caldariorum]|uniref:uncharacterized protein n=1 Tax=Daldinia caldariorum TaxID=326644 RepID=UPI002008C7E9|nr:uncharacterized protein F4812DRAFT_431608 [Daldinia caldariorum]KAI1467201.1 hypothetical protein F4812DRAFT_431608 [Daldinia caldariorum]